MLFQLDADGKSFRPANFALSDLNVRANMYVSEDGRLWLGNDRGLTIIGPGDAREEITSMEGLPEGSIQGLLFDRSGSLWLGTEPLSRMLGGGIVQNFTKLHGLPADNVWAIMRDRNNRMWVGTDVGVAKLVGGRFERIPGMDKSRISTISESKNGTMVFAGSSNLFSLDENGNVQRVGQANGLPTGIIIYRVFFDRKDNLWLATDGAGLLKGNRVNGVWVISPTEITGGHSHERFVDVTEDSKGRILAAGDSGLAVLDGGKWIRFTKNDGLRTNSTAFVRQIRNGDILLAYFGSPGIFRGRLEGRVLKSFGHLGDDMNDLETEGK